MPDVTFYFDVGSPYAYLASERLTALIPEPVTWQPVLLGGPVQADRPQLLGARRLPAATGRHGRDRATGTRLRAAADPLARPLADRLPRGDAGDHLRVHRRRGRGRGGAEAGSEFAHEAFRAAFQRGHELSIVAHVLAVATRAGLDAGAVQRAIADPEIKTTLRAATDAAFERGVFGVPTLAVGDELFWGDDRLEDAAAYLGTRARNVTQR